MKTNLAKKAIVAAMTTAMGAGIVGSISGTVAWYQYSTRSTVVYDGAAAHCTEALEIATSQNGQYSKDLTAAQIGARAGLRPVTSGALAASEVAPTLRQNPIYQYAESAKWGVADSDKDYVEFDVWGRVQDLDNTGTSFLKNKPIYLTDVTIAAVAAAGKIDLTNAVRVAIKDGAGNDWATYSQTGAAVDVYGNLDLNKDGHPDKDNSYSFQQGNLINYGDDQKVAASYARTDRAEDGNTHKIANDDDPYHILGAPLATTGADGSAVKICTVRIYLEGWTKLNNVDPTLATFADITARDAAEATNLTEHGIYKVTDSGDGTPKWYTFDGVENEQKQWTEVGNPVAASAIWDIGESIGAQFNVGLRFSTTPHDDADHVA